MKRFSAALLALCLLLAGCAKNNTPAGELPEPPQVTEQPAPLPQPESEPIPEAEPESEPMPSAGMTELTCAELVVPIPLEYAELVIADIEPEAWSEHWTPLVSLSEAASVAAGQNDHPGEDLGDGMLCAIARLDRIGFEDWISGDRTGTRLFAVGGAGQYYLLSQPTDVRFYRSGESTEGVELWTELCRWADEELPAAVCERNGLTPYDASDLLGADYTYPGAHVDLACRFPDKTMDLIILSLSQPVRQGEGGVWCVDRIHEVYSDYSFTDSYLVFPASFGENLTAADYYAQLQEACDAGEYPELLTPEGAALDYARRDSVKWLFGEDISATDFSVYESLG